MSSPGERKDNKWDVNIGGAWRGQPLLQRAQGEHRPRHRTPQPAECLGPIFLRQLSFPGTIIQFAKPSLPITTVLRFKI